MKPTLEHFNLSKIVTDKKIKVEYTDLTGNFKVSFPDAPHPDLLNCLKSLNKYFAQRIGLTDGLIEAIKNNPDSEPELTEIVEKQFKRCTVYGASYVGKDDKEGLKLIGNLDCSVSGFSLTTPVIVFQDDKLGFEYEVADIAEDLKVEVFKYLFENKRAQLNILDAIDESESENSTETETQS